MPVDNFHFHTLDYVVFSLILLVSAGSGVYYAYYSRKHLAEQRSTNANRNYHNFGSRALSEYLLGSRRLHSFPVAMSLVGSYISAVTVLGTPTEIYYYGTQYFMIIVPIMLMGWTISKVYLPVFCSLKVGSSYEYLELRFGPKVRTIASCLFVMDEIFFLPMIIYVPAMAFNQVTGANLYLMSGIICIVCIFYTIIGGIRAVVFTDSFQVAVMFTSVLIVVLFGVINAGGPAVVFHDASLGGRLIFFDVNPSMYERQSIWAVCIGGYVYWTAFNSCNQTMIQRYMTLPSLEKARHAVVYYIAGIVLFVSVCCFAGLLLFSNYKDCDPMHSKLIQFDDQLFPLFVMQTMGHILGFPGLFLAGVCGAALSSLSVVLNSTAGVILEDIIRGAAKRHPSDKHANLIVKGSIAFLGILAMLLVLVVEHLGGVLKLATSLTAIAASTSAGAFTLGILVPRSNTKGTISGMIAGGILSAWVVMGSQVEYLLGRLKDQKLPVYIHGCKDHANTTVVQTIVDNSNVFFLHKLSFHWVSPIGVFTVIVVGTAVSYLTGGQKNDEIDPELISPVIHRFLPKICFENFGKSRANAVGARFPRNRVTLANEATILTPTNLVFIPDGEPSQSKQSKPSA